MTDRVIDLGRPWRPASTGGSTRSVARFHDEPDPRTIDAWLADPTTALELEEALARLETSEDLRIKAPDYPGSGGKRHRLSADEAAALILRAWREQRP